MEARGCPGLTNSVRSPRSSGVGLLEWWCSALRDVSTPRRYPPEFRARALALLDAGRHIAESAHDFGIGTQTLTNWRRKALVDVGERTGLSSVESPELRAARASISRLRDETTILPRAYELSNDVSSREGGSR
jgi:transposase